MAITQGAWSKTLSMEHQYFDVLFQGQTTQI